MTNARERRSAGKGLLIAAGIAAVGLLLWAERKKPLRKTPAQLNRHEGRRLTSNLALAGLGALATEMAMTPVVVPLAKRAERHRTGLVQQLPLPVWLRNAIAVVLLDYTLYWWHVLEHRIPVLYRLHQVHHADLALDSSTALRFHFGEFLASVPWRAAQVALIGASPRALRRWNTLTMCSVLFHHSNVRLPLRVERLLALLIMTPRLHGIHHSMVREEQDSNWSSGLTIWDRLHGTYRANVPQGSIALGIPALRQAHEVDFVPSLAMPIHPVRPWRLPDGSTPQGVSAHEPGGTLVE